jgi:hypothetical protein
MEDASGWNVRKDVNPFSVWTTSNKTSNAKASNDLTERVQQLEMELDVKQNDLTMAAGMFILIHLLDYLLTYLLIMMQKC